MPDQLFKDLEHHRKQLNKLMENPQKDLESWYLAVEYCSNKIGELGRLIAVRRIGMFYCQDMSHS